MASNRVGFSVKDVEMGRESEDTGGSNSRELSVVGPLPSETLQETAPKSSASARSGSASNGSYSKKFSLSPPSILKKRSNSIKGSGSVTAKTGASGFTGSVKTSSTGGSSTSGQYQGSKRTPRHVWYSRWLFLTLLCMVAASLGYLTYDVLTKNERYLADCLFGNIADYAIATISKNQKRKKLGMDSMGSVIAATGAESQQWPFVTQTDYETLAKNIIDTSKGCNIAYGPILTPEQVPDFEAYAEDFYQNSRRPEVWPEGTGVKVEDRVAVWSMGPDGPVHDTSGETAMWNSTHRIIVPMYQHSAGPVGKLMFNMHFSPLLGKTIEDMMACAEETKVLIQEHELMYSNLSEEDEAPPAAPSLKDCTIVTELAHNKTSFVQGEPMGPGANMMQPIFPAFNKTEMTGVLVTQIVWTENMNDVFTDNSDGVYIVMDTPTQTVTFQVVGGNVVYQGIGDLHDTKHENCARVGNVTLSEYFAPQSTPYTITLYPSEAFYAGFATKNPTYATIGAICVMLFTVLMFMAYDFLVRREFNAKHELLKAKRHFMRYVSHEVRTPLNSVCMGLNLMQEEIQAKLINPGTNGSDSACITVEEAKSWLSLSRDVHVSAQSATNVLNDFLNYDKIESRQLTLELSTITIQPLINEIVTEFVLPAQDKKIRLSVIQEKLNASDHLSSNRKLLNEDSRIDIDSQLLEDQVVVGDKARLSQVVRNVISNAIKFTPEAGSIDVKMTWHVASVGESTNVNLQDGLIECLHQTGWIEIEVTDTGHGMTPEQLATVFESGVQFNANKNQKGGGSGLGLFIAKGIVDQHNGTLTVNSEGMGKGTSFVCKLPLYCKPKCPMLDHIPLSPDDSVTERVCSTWLDEHDEKDLCYRILVVDDAPMNRKLLTRLLLKRGHTVDMAEDGLQALEMVTEEEKKGKRYDTILMDFQMPVMDGPTSAQEIRKIGCDSFIVGITGNVLPQDIEHFKNCGADGVLGKPFQVEELESMWTEYGVTSE